MIHKVNQARLNKKADDGISTVELLVTMIIFAVVLSVVTTAIIAMLRQERTESAQNDNMNASRKIQETLDSNVRYADDITTPGTGTDPNGDTYVEWRTTNSSAVASVCTQWRFVPTTSTIQVRKWTEPFNGNPAAITQNWTTLQTGIKQTGSTPIFALGPYNTVDGLASVNGTYQGHQQLTMTFSAYHAPETMNNAITITAINSAVSAVNTFVYPPITSSTCTEEGRS